MSQTIEKRPVGRPTDYRHLSIAEAKRWPNPCVYGLTDGDEIFYVGMTERPKYRFGIHKRNTGENPILKRKIAEVGDALCVVILHDNPRDIRSAETREIMSRTGLCNLVDGDDDVWLGYHEKPWAASTKYMCPSSRLMIQISAEGRIKARERIAKMDAADRCIFEFNLLLKEIARGGVSESLKQWFRIFRDRMFECIEAKYGSANNV